MKSFTLQELWELVFTENSQFWKWYEAGTGWTTLADGTVRLDGIEGSQGWEAEQCFVYFLKNYYKRREND